MYRDDEMDCLFCGFATGEATKNTNGYPFIPIKMTKHSISFLATDFIAHEEGHTLVIPKKHFENLEDMPKQVMHDVIEHVALVAKATRNRHRACNVLLNNGASAGQYVMHAHFHVIPRDKGDRIDMEGWPRGRLSLHRFRELTSNISQDLKSVSRRK